jgi:hypothetical protein
MNEQTAQTNGKHQPPETHGTGSVSGDFTQMDDSALLSMRAEMRAELERLPPASPAHAALTALYDKTTEEVDDRARRAWTRAS